MLLQIISYSYLDNSPFSKNYYLILRNRNLNF
jgi:hypothetical protein